MTGAASQKGRETGDLTAAPSSRSNFPHGPLALAQPILMPFLHIPPELMIRILLYLSPHDIISCKRTCRMLYDMCNEPVLRYLIQMERCAVGDDMRPGLGYIERLRILEKREEAWATLNFRSSLQVSVPFDPADTYNISGGAFFLGTRHSHANELTVGYSYISLPSISDDEKVEWKGFKFRIPILNIGLAVHEHDLIAAVTKCVFLGFLIIV
jgi:hypothetical protein